MSAFLGPIHHAMYNKISFQNNFVNVLIETLDNKELKSEVANNTVDLTGKPLEEVIDLTNIHHSLQSMIFTVENRLALTVGLILKNNLIDVEKISELAREYASNFSVSKETPVEAFTLMAEYLLDGMPCDRIVSILEKSDEFVLWTNTADPHRRFWDELNLDYRVYYSIRNAFISGLIGSGFKFEEVEEYKYQISLNSGDMDNIEVLEYEHNNIIKMLGILKKKALKLMNKEDVEISFFDKFIDFTRNYADKHHHGKEEKILFKYMVENLGPVAEKLVTNGMLVEHDMGRYYIAKLEEAVNSFRETNSDEDRLTILMSSMAYYDLLQRHVGKENEVVYTFARRAISPELMEVIEKESIEFEIEFKARKEKYETMLEELEKTA